NKALLFAIPENCSYAIRCRTDDHYKSQRLVSIVFKRYGHKKQLSIADRFIGLKHATLDSLVIELSILHNPFLAILLQLFKYQEYSALDIWRDFSAIVFHFGKFTKRNGDWNNHK